MSAWTDSLGEPLATALAGRPWKRVESARQGGWLLLADEGAGDGVSWYHLPEGEQTPIPISPLQDARLPELRALLSESLRAGLGTRLLGHKVGRRAIVALDGEERRIVKVFRKARSIEERWRHFPSESKPWRVPKVIAWDAERRRLLVEHCRGTSFNERWLGDDAAAEDGDRIAELLRWIAKTPPGDAIPTHGVEDEIRVLEERLPAYEAVLRNPNPKARELTARVAEALRDDAAATTVSAHRDFHDKQILLENGGGTLIDLDLAAAAPAALDAGNIIAHTRLRALKGAPVPWREICGRIVAGLPPAVPADSLHRWMASTLLRLALIYSRRARSDDLLDLLLDSTEQALERGGEWREVLG